MHGIEIVVGKSITWLFDHFATHNYLIPRLHGKNFYGPSPVNAHCIAGNGKNLARRSPGLFSASNRQYISNGM